MKSKGIRNLLIDLGGVSINLDRERCTENFKKIRFWNIEEKFCTHQLDGIFLQQGKGLVTPAEFRDGTREMMGKMVSDKQIDATWNNSLVDIPTYKLDLLLKLYGKYIVHLLSNTSDIRWKWVCKDAFPYRTFKIEGCFGKTYLPHEMRATRPELKIFKAVTEDTGIGPRETFFVDDFETDCKIARELGTSTYTPKTSEDWSHLFRRK